MWNALIQYIHCKSYRDDLSEGKLSQRVRTVGSTKLALDKSRSVLSLCERRHVANQITALKMSSS